jgi:N-acetylmuramoyl-L-alanine amidase
MFDKIFWRLYNAANKSSQTMRLKAFFVGIVEVVLIVALILFLGLSSLEAALVIDPGHGGYDPGATDSGVEEKDLNLEISKKVASLLNSSGINTRLTRDGDVYLSLSERVQFTKEIGGDLFISVHHNWASTSQAKGIEVYYYNSGDERERKSKTLADLVRKEIIRLTGQVDRGTKSANFYVLRENNIPAILVECGFLSNSEERSLLLQDSFQWKIAKGIFNGIIKYLKSQTFLIKADGTFDVYDSSGNRISTFSSGDLVSVLRDSDTFYIYNTGGATKQVRTNIIKFKPRSSSTIFEIVSYEDRPSWNPSLNDNLFRGSIELNYSSLTGEVWVVNELPIEDYVKGVAEQTNDNPAEFLKAMAVAERTYALWHVTHGGKYPDKPFHLTNTSNDQVYKGYGYEKRAPNVVSAVNATKGIVVTYQGKVAITPYFSGSDGRTRSWEEVWGSKNFPWCQSVPDPLGYRYLDSQGKPVWYTVGGANHGVGMSCAGARRFAGEKNYTFQQILKYYYTGVGVKSTDTNKLIRVGIFKFSPYAGVMHLKGWQSTAWSWEKSKLTSGDVNGDGKTDALILYNYGRNRVALWAFYSNGASFSHKKVWQSTAWSWEKSKLTSGDVNGDGKTDALILYNYGSAKVALWILKQ